MNKLRRLAVIPARGGSKRIPRKNIVDFHGKPMLAHVLGTARDSLLFDTIHVSTDDAEIAAIASHHGHEPDFMRDPMLADDYTPLMPVLSWVAGRYAELGHAFDSICLLMATSVLIEPADLTAAYELFDRLEGVRPVMAVAEFPAPVEWAFRLGGDMILEPVQPGAANIRSQDLPKAYYDSGTFILLPAAAVAGAHEMPPCAAFPIARWKAVDIDGPEDLDLARRLHAMRSS